VPVCKTEFVPRDPGGQGVALGGDPRGAGCVIAGVAASAGEAMAIIGQADIQAAILDVNLDEGRSMIVADLLRQKGVPFIFETGYGKAGVPKQFANVPLLPKPFTSEDLTKTLATVTPRVR